MFLGYTGLEKQVISKGKIWDIDIENIDKTYRVSKKK